MAFANVIVDINTDQDIILDLEFSPGQTTYNLTAGTHQMDISGAPTIIENDFLQSDALVDWNTEIVQKTFSEFKGSDKEKIVSVIEYIQKNVQYNLSSIAAQGSKSASWVLEHNEGVCDEITATFIAGARLHNIPARFVHGYAYTTSELFNEPWQPHTWAEVYIGEWIPIDITFNQYTKIYDDHIPFIISNEMEQNQFSVQYTGVAPNIDIEYTINYTPEQKTFGEEFEVSIPYAVNHVSHIPISVITDNDNIKSLDLYAPDNFELIVPSVITKKARAWLIPPPLSTEYIYTIPITLKVGDTFKNYSVIMDDTDTFYTYEETSEGTKFWCEFDPDLVCYSEEPSELCIDECYIIDTMGTKIKYDHEVGMNSIAVLLNGEYTDITYYVAPEHEISCQVYEDYITIEPTNQHTNVNVKILTPFEIQSSQYDQISKKTNRTFKLQTKFSGMVVNAEIVSDQSTSNCSNIIEYKVEGWDLIPNFFYKILSKIISYA